MSVLYKTISIFIFFQICIPLVAQTDSIKTDTVFDGHTVSSDWIDHGILVGIDFSKYLYVDIAYYRSYIWEAGGFPALSTTMNYGMEFSYFDDLVIAPKIQGRIHVLFFNTSLTALMYTNLRKEYSIKLRPEIGIGLWNFDINYGYNIGIYNNDFNQTNTHVISIRYYLNLYRKYLNEYDGNIRPN